METFSNILILFHALLGSVSLLAGTIVLLIQKGKKWHKIFGNIFYYSMLIVAISALFIAVLPNHTNPFLFAIGLFSSYFILSGKRALRFKTLSPNRIDFLLAWSMLFISIIMISASFLFLKNLTIVLIVFGLLGSVLAWRDIKNYQNKINLNSKWLKLHISKMMGGYISAFTAFIVANQIIGGIIGWLAPGLIGGIHIAYWIKKLNKNKGASNT